MSLINPPAEKSIGVKSGDLGGQAVGPPLPAPTSRKSLIQKCGNISVEVRWGTVLLKYETGRYMWDGRVLQHVEVALSCHSRLHEEKWTDHTMFMQS
jgi:hypothetical protein